MSYFLQGQLWLLSPWGMLTSDSSGDEGHKGRSLYEGPSGEGVTGSLARAGWSPQVLGEGQHSDSQRHPRPPRYPDPGSQFHNVITCARGGCARVPARPQFPFLKKGWREVSLPWGHWEAVAGPVMGGRWLGPGAAKDIPWAGRSHAPLVQQGLGETARGGEGL